MNIVICIALEKELPDLIKSDYPHLWCRIQQLQAGYLVDLKALPFLIVITGVGHKSKNALDWICRNLCPDEIINIGTAGGNLLKTWHMCHKVSHFDSDIVLKSNLVSCLPIPYHEFQISSCLTVDKVSNIPDINLVDMESYYILEICNSFNIPCSIFKFVTDDVKNHNYQVFNENLIFFKEQFIHFLNKILVKRDFSISVIIPVYNRHDLFQRALSSVLSQSLFPNEIIIVDDGSEIPIVNPSQNDNIHLIRFDSNCGVSVARNAGINHSTSDWIAFLDSDDEWDFNHLESLYSYLNENPLIKWAQTEEKWVRNGKHLNKKLYHEKPSGWAFEQSLSRCLVSPSAVIIHRSMFDEFGYFNESMRVCEDYDLWLRFLRYRPVGYISEVTMTKFGGHPDQLSMSTPVMDRFRLFSLLILLNDVANDHLNIIIKDKIIEKLSVLIQGAKKRNHSLLPLYISINQKVLTNKPFELDDISKIIFD